jgi:hypothetical protein
MRFDLGTRVSWVSRYRRKAEMKVSQGTQSLLVNSWQEFNATSSIVTRASPSNFYTFPATTEDIEHGCIPEDDFLNTIHEILMSILGKSWKLH